MRFQRPPKVSNLVNYLVDQFILIADLTVSVHDSMCEFPEM